MAALVRSERTPESLSREFEPSAQAIRNRVEQSDRDAGLRANGLTSAERQELRRSQSGKIDGWDLKVFPPKNERPRETQSQSPTGNNPPVRVKMYTACR